MAGKTLVSKDDLQDFAGLFKTAASQLRDDGNDALAKDCEQAAEFIEGYYLPYDEKGRYVETKEVVEQGVSLLTCQRCNMLVDRDNPSAHVCPNRK